MKIDDESSFFVFIFVFLVVVLIASYLLINVEVNYQKSLYEKIPIEGSYCNFDNHTVLSFTLDDVTFEKNQNEILNNVLYIARKYGITFDLGVIALPFDENSDDETFDIYKNNQDVFEIVAHGFTHGLDTSIADQYPLDSVHGEFYVLPIDKNVPLNIQRYHILRMRDIFGKHNLTLATEIFVTPYHAGDFNTTLLLGQYGYSFVEQKITSPQTFSEIKFGNITETQDYIDLPLRNYYTKEDTDNYNLNLSKAIAAGQNKIDIKLHPINFENLESADYFIGQLVSSMKNSSDIKFDFISDRFRC